MIRYPFFLKPARYPRRRLDFKRIGVAAFALFVLFTAFRILTPPSFEVATAASPDGSKTARLRKFYYLSQPSYKIYYRESGERMWQNLLYLPSYTNVPHQAAVETLEWSPDSERLYLKINGTSVWHYVFE